MLLNKWELFLVCHHSVKFGGHSFCINRDAFSLSVDHARTRDYNDRSPSRLSHHHVKCGGHGHCSSENIMALVCYMIQNDHMVKGSSKFMGGSRIR